MADGDIIHSRLGGIYQKPYKWLCEGKATIDECAHVLMQAFKKDIVRKGDLPVQLAQTMAEILDRAISAAENSPVNWAGLTLEFDKLVQQADGSHRLKEVVRLTGKSLLHDFRYGQYIDSSNTIETFLHRYMKTVYESEFKERVPLTSTHHDGIDQATLSKRIGEIKPIIDDVIGKWAKTAIKHHSIEKLPIPHRSAQKPIDLNEDLR